MNHSKIRKFLIISLFNNWQFVFYSFYWYYASCFLIHRIAYFCESEYPGYKTAADIVDPRIQDTKLLRILWIRVSRIQNCCGYYGSSCPGCKTIMDIMDPRIQDTKLLRILWIRVSRIQNYCGYYGSACPGYKTIASIMDPRVQDTKLLRIFYGFTYIG